MSRLRGHAFVIAVASAALCCSAASGAAAVEIPLPPVTGEFSGAVHPRDLPRDRLGVSIEMGGVFATVDGSPLPALREAVIDFGPDGKVDPSGLAVCQRPRLESSKDGASAAGCKQSKIGAGVATLEATPSRQLEARLAAYNGGGTATTATIFITMDIVGLKNDPPVTVVKVRPHRNGKGIGLRTIWRVPQLLNGGAALKDFNLKFGRAFQSRGEQHNYLEASCSTGQVTASLVRAVLKDERGTGIGDQTLAGDVFLPCN